MGEFALSENQEFMVEQIHNTMKIVTSFSDDSKLSYTALQNALLSLVLLPFESAKKKDGTKVWQGSYSDVCEAIGFNEITFKPIAECRDGKVRFNNRTQYSFIKKFRNAIAHQNINLRVKDQKIEALEFHNSFPANCASCSNKECPARQLKRVSGGIEDFRVSFTYKQLHDFAFYVAASYTRSITGKALEERKDNNGQS